MPTETVSTAVAKRESGPRQLIEEYRSDFTTVLPSHIKPETWVRVAQGALKKGRKQGDHFELEIAAMNNPPAFLSALLDAARQGLEPGTEQYYLTPRKVKGRLEILGIRGYQGEIELMYRAGAISSVIVELVRERDTFIWTPGLVDTATPRRWDGAQTRPYHQVEWFAERGAMVGVYAYAVMKDGAISKVVVLNRTEIEKIRAVSQGGDSEYSPWNKWEDRMWLKSAAHQLTKWVPTSSEYLKEQLRAVRDVQAEGPRPLIPHDVPPPASVDTDTGEVIDGEIVNEPTQAELDEMAREMGGDQNDSSLFGGDSK